MNPEPLLAWLRNFGGAITKALTPTQLLSLVLTFAAVVGVTVGAAYWITTPTYGVLFSDLEPEAAARVVADLQASQTRYKIDAGGRTVRVPVSQLDTLRLEFASSGLPESGRIGFEIFDRTAFGATEFIEQVNLRRALEGELARTISSIGEIDGARVHVAMAQQALFGRTERKATASVVLRLHSRNDLSEATIRGVSNLVAAGIEGLQPEAVVLMDSFGRLLHPTDDAAEASGSGRHVERREQLEQDLTQRVVALLEPVVGTGRVRANVAVVLRTESEEATEESWDPTTVVARSRHVSGDRAFLDAAAQGLSGARANLPPSAATATAAPPADPASGDASALETPAGPDDPSLSEPASSGLVASTSRTPSGTGTETTNYEISKSVRRVVRPAGDISRLSVAVILDDRLVSEPDAEGEPGQRLESRAPEDVEKVRGLVAAAIGFDPERGDLLTVENIAFEPVAPPELIAPIAVWERYLPQIMEVVRIGAALLLTLALFQFGLRPMVRRVVTAAPAGGRQIAEGQQGALSDVGQQAKIGALSTHATTLSHREPEHAARLVRAWLDEEKSR